jgi:predicted acetyltransferase
MESVLVTAEPEHAGVVANLFQLYVHDFSEIVPVVVGDDGRFSVPPFETWQHRFLLRVEGRWAGFAMVNQRSRITGDPTTWDVAEFFVMRGYRRGGVGARAATELFARFPGRWEVRQTPTNVAATAFWRAVIGSFTDWQFDETVHDSERWRGPVQSFASQRSG